MTIILDSRDSTVLRARQQDVASPYGYVPTEWICIVFVSLFGVSTILHLLQTFKYRLWWLLPTACLCGIAEVIGWSARLWSSQNPTLLIPYEIQITTTIIAPTPLVAANFIILGRIVSILGAQYSRLTPRLYTIVFCSCDLISLTVQAVGGAMAADAASSGDDPSPGGNVMLGGIIFQMISITIYVLCAGEFFSRFLSDRPFHKRILVSKDKIISRGLDRNMRFMIIALMFDTTCLFIRAVYRTLELADGWTGTIITTQWYFNAFDAGMITLAIYTLNLAHPGRLLADASVVQPKEIEFHEIPMHSRDDLHSSDNLHSSAEQGRLLDS